MKNKSLTQQHKNDWNQTSSNNQYRDLDEEIKREAWEQIVDMFQDFVLCFTTLAFTKGKRRMLLYLIIKTEGDIFQELRDYDRAIKAYKALLSYCELWKLATPIIHTLEQIGLCYRLNRLHSAAVDYFKMALQYAWTEQNVDAELRCYDMIALEYYYLGDMERMQIFNNRFIQGKIENDKS